MDDKEKFIVRISCEPKFTPTDIGGTKIVDKLITFRAEKVNEIVISQLRDLMIEKGINELIAIDERKVLEITEKAQAFDIIVEKEVNITFFKMCLSCGWEYELFEENCLDNDEYNETPPYKHSMTKEQFELVKEAIYGKDRIGD